ncbi:hypothetical protein JCM10213_001754 [Rhodosporidiobolus nylandii]
MASTAAEAKRTAASGSGDELKLTLRLATHPVLPTPLTRTLSFPREGTVGELKQRLEAEWDGKPKKDGVTAVKGGRVLRDAEKVAEVFEEELKLSPVPELVLHVIIRPTAWSAPFTETPIPSPSPAPAPLPLSLSTPAAAPDGEVLEPTPLPSPSIGRLAPPEIRETPPTPSSSPPPPPHATAGGYTPGYVSAPPAASPSAPAAAAEGAAPATAAAASGGAAGSYAHYLSHLQRLIPLQRALLLLNLQKAHVHYASLIASLSAALNSTAAESESKDAEGLSELSEVRELLEGCGLWGKVERAGEQARKEVEELEKKRKEEGEKPVGEELRVVQIGGLPYLLHVPSTAAPPLPSATALSALRRAQETHKILTTLLQLLVTFQPSIPAIAYGRAAPPVPGTAGAGGIRPGYRPAAPGAGAFAQAFAQQQHLAGLAAAGQPIPVVNGAAPAAAGGAPGAAGRPRALVSITINLDVLLTLFVPLFFLALKLAFLLWIFGRHASTTKRILLGIMALLWVAYEGWGIQRRRQQAVRERERLERERRRAARAARPPAAPAPAGAAPVAQQQPAAAGANPAPAPAPGGAAQPPQPAAPQARRRATPRRPPPSYFSPKYWINTLAAVGLVAEARELGLQPRFIAGRPIPPAGPPPRTPNERRKETLKRALRNVGVGVVLFVATLSPEVERKRKRALEKRERLLLERRQAEERQRALKVITDARMAEHRRRDAEAAAQEKEKAAAPAQPPKAADIGTSSADVVVAMAGASSSKSSSDAPPPAPAANAAEEEDAAERLERIFGTRFTPPPSSPDRHLSPSEEFIQSEYSDERTTMQLLREQERANREAEERAEKAYRERCAQEGRVVDEFEMLQERAKARREREEEERKAAVAQSGWGRVKVPDAELFRDGGSDAYATQAEASTSAGPSAPASASASAAPTQDDAQPPRLDPVAPTSQGESSGTPAAIEQLPERGQAEEPVPVPDLVDPLPLDEDSASASGASGASREGSTDGDGEGERARPQEEVREDRVGALF